MEPIRTTTFTLTRADALAYEQASARFSPLGMLALILWLGLFGSLAFILPRDLPFRDIRESILTRTHLFLVSDDGVLILPRAAFPEEGVIDDLAARIAGRPLPAKVDADVSPA